MHTHFLSLPFIKHLQGRSSLPRTVLEGGVYVIDCAQGWRLPTVPNIVDMEVKLADTAEMGIDVSVLSHGIPGPEVLAEDEADDWASRMNDDLARIIDAYPGQFLGFGNIGFGSPERCIREAERCVKELGFKGIQLFSNVNNRTLDQPEFLPVYQCIAELGVPLNMHPATPMNLNGLDNSSLIVPLGFLYDTSLNTIRLIQSGIFDEAPDLNLIVPHIGGIVPYQYGRIDTYNQHTLQFRDRPPLARPMHEYLDKLYIDTVCYDPKALEYCLAVFGPERILYGTDHPFGNYRLAADIIEQSNCSAADRDKLYRGNALQLLKIAA